MNGLPNAMVLAMKDSERQPVAYYNVFVLLFDDKFFVFQKIINALFFT